MPTAEELYDRGVDLFAEGKYDEAIAAYGEALGLDPGFVDALHGLAMAHAEKGELEAAIAAAKRITEASARRSARLHGPVDALPARGPHRRSGSRRQPSARARVEAAAQAELTALPRKPRAIT